MVLPRYTSVLLLAVALYVLANYLGVSPLQMALALTDLALHFFNEDGLLAIPKFMLFGFLIATGLRALVLHPLERGLSRLARR